MIKTNQKLIIVLAAVGWLLVGCAFLSPAKRLILFSVQRGMFGDAPRVAYFVYNPGEDLPPREIYEAPHNSYGWFSADGENIILLSYEPAPNDIIRQNASLVSVKTDGSQVVTWVESARVLAGSPLTGRFSPDGRLFFYILPDEEMFIQSLYVAKSDGSDRLLIGQATKLSAVFTPDSDHLLVSSAMFDKEDPKKLANEIYTVSPDGEDKKILWQGEGYSDVAVYLTPDGNLIFQMWRLSAQDNETEVFLTDPEFKEFTLIARYLGRPRSFLVSPDGNAYFLGRECDGKTCDPATCWNVASVGNASGSGDLLNVGCWTGSGAEYSPDSRMILIAFASRYGEREINPGGAYFSLLLTAQGDLIEEFPMDELIRGSFSPESDGLVYWKRSETEKTSCIYIRELETGEESKLEDTCLAEGDFPGMIQWYKPSFQFQTYWR
jgi:hypothetical protein